MIVAFFYLADNPWPNFRVVVLYFLFMPVFSVPVNNFFYKNISNKKLSETSFYLLFVFWSIILLFFRYFSFVLVQMIIARRYFCFWHSVNFLKFYQIYIPHQNNGKYSALYLRIHPVNNRWAEMIGVDVQVGAPDPLTYRL